jgi:hypothetical protein
MLSHLFRHLLDTTHLLLATGRLRRTIIICLHTAILLLPRDHLVIIRHMYRNLRRVSLLHKVNTMFGIIVSSHNRRGKMRKRSNPRITRLHLHKTSSLQLRDLCKPNNHRSNHSSHTPSSWQPISERGRKERSSRQGTNRGGTIHGGTV